MSNHIKIDELNLTLIDLESILPDIEVSISNDLYKFGLSDTVKLGNKDTLSLIYHHLILNICEEVKKCTQTTYKVVIYHPEMTFLTDLLDISTGSVFINGVFGKFSRLLPINFYKLPFNVRYTRKVLADHVGEGAELRSSLEKFTNTDRKSLYSFRKIEKFGTR